MRRVVRFAMAGLVVPFLVSSAETSPDDPSPAYFSERFGGVIDRVVVGPDRTIYVAGRTTTSDLPASLSAPEPGSDYNGPWALFFAAALEPDGRPRWTAYAPSRSNPGLARVYALAVAPDGSVWIAGRGNVEPVAAFQEGHDDRWHRDGFVARFASDGLLLLASPLGGASDDWIVDLAVTATGDAIASGTTYSGDFPGAALPAGPVHEASDAFVARLRSDGSGPAWVRRFGSEDDSVYFRGGGVAVDPSDGTIVVAMAGTRHGDRAPFAGDLAPPRGIPGAECIENRQAPLLIRLDADGAQVQGARLCFLGVPMWGPPPAVAIDADRQVIVGGSLGVARTSPELFLGTTGAWLDRSRFPRPVERVSVGAGGRLALLLRSDPYYPGRLVLLDSDLTHEERPPPRDVELAFGPDDVAVWGDGDLVVVGRGFGAPFHASTDTVRPDSGCIARIPVDGVRGPSRLRARVTGTREVDLSWSRGGDAAIGYDVERVYWNSPPRLLARAPAGVSRFRLSGLTPGASHQVRVVAEFASGVRSASREVSFETPPERPLAVVASDGPGLTADLQFDDANGNSTVWQIQRRFGEGAWMETGVVSGLAPYRYVGERLYSPQTTDVVPDVSVPVRWRVRSLSHSRRTSWVESAPLVPSSSMRLTQTNGRFGPVDSGGREFLVSGTLTAAASSPPLAFDPATQDIRLFVGSATAPREFVLPKGYPGWTSAGGVHRWSAAESLSTWSDGSEVVLDLAHGTFLARLVSSNEWDGGSTNRIAVNLAFGGFSGGDVQTWPWHAASASLLFGDDAARRTEVLKR